MVIYRVFPHIVIKDVICGVMAMRMKRVLKLLPFIIVLVVSCILLLTEFLSIEPIMADDSIDTQASTHNLELIPFFWTVGIVGGFIGLTLAYVGWRKYRDEEKKKTKKENKKKSYL